VFAGFAKQYVPRLGRKFLAVELVSPNELPAIFLGRLFGGKDVHGQKCKVERSSQ